MMFPSFIVVAFASISSFTMTACLAFQVNHLPSSSSFSSCSSKPPSMKRMAESSSSSSSNKNNKVVPTTTTTWSDYKDCFIGPSVQQKKKQASSTLTGPHVNPDQRLSSDQFWYKQFEEERQRLQEMNQHDPDIARTVVSKRPSITTPFDIYEHLYLDPIMASSSHDDDNNDPSSNHRHSHQPVLSPSITQKIYNPQKRAEADEYWYQTFMEEKAKLQKYNTNLNKEKEQQQQVHEFKQQQDKKIQPKSQERKWFWDGWFSQQKEEENPSSSSSLSP